MSKNWKRPALRTAWKNMLARCSDPRVHNYASYGGRGITVCDRWRTFENFATDMGTRPEGATLDRIDVNGHYEPGNCRWADAKTQQRNRQRNHVVTHEGVTATVAEWAERTGIKASIIYKRLTLGWPPEKALTVAKRKVARVSVDERQRILALRASGLREAAIAQQVGRSRSVVYRCIAEAGDIK